MTAIDRRSAALIALLAPFAASTTEAGTRPAAVPGSRSAAGRDVALLVYPGLTALDLVGPQYMLAALEDYALHLVGRTTAPVASDTGLVLAPTRDFTGCPDDLAILLVPGGTDGTLAAMRDPETLAFLADRGGRAGLVASVCTGSLLLAAAGLLRGYRATSHWAAREALAAFGALPTAGRVVRDRNRLTAAGVTAGLDLGLTIVADLRGADYAELVQLGCEYDPAPPFSAGSPETAPPAVTAEMRRLLAGFVAGAEAVARAEAAPPRDAPGTAR